MTFDAMMERWAKFTDEDVAAIVDRFWVAVRSKAPFSDDMDDIGVAGQRSRKHYREVHGITADTLCKCGGSYGDHNYSSSVPPDPTRDPLGSLYECRCKGGRLLCPCERFEAA